MEVESAEPSTNRLRVFARARSRRPHAASGLRTALNEAAGAGDATREARAIGRVACGSQGGPVSHLRQTIREMAISAAGAFGWAGVSRRRYAARAGVVESAAAIERRQNGHHTLHRKIRCVSHPLALALFSTASMAAEAAAALHALGISREHSPSSHTATPTRGSLLNEWTRRPAWTLKIRDRRHSWENWAAE